MCALAYTFVRSREAAEDIVGNVFQNLWLRRLEWDVRVPLQSYLLTATRNTAIDLLRRIRREAGLAARALSADVVPAFSAPATPPDRAVIAQDLAAAIEQVISELPPRCREVFALRWQGGLRHQEIASRVGVSLKTVEMHITRALKVIRERVQGYL
jgi:RNA polymerase sigma-70 factor (ECF subfamily)